MDCPGFDGRDSRNIFLPLRDLRRTGQGDLVRLAWRTWLAILLPCGLAFPAQAQFKMGESFRSSTAPGWTIAGTDNCGMLGCLLTPLNDDSGILTGGYGNITETQTNDANGNGWLRLTTKRGNQQGRALYTGGSFPSSQGVIVEFDYTIWGGSGADGLTFFLYNATSNMVGAQFGGSLAYCGGAGAYLGVGLDEFGNFSSSAPGVSGGCPQAGGGPGSRPDNVVIRGPASDSYRYITGAAASSSLDVSPNVNPRPGNSSRVRLSLVPNGSGGYPARRVCGAIPTQPQSAGFSTLDRHHFGEEVIATKPLLRGLVARTDAWEHRSEYRYRERSLTTLTKGSTKAAAPL